MTKSTQDTVESVARLDSRLVAVEGGMLKGHVLDRKNPERRFIVELYVDDQPLNLARADVLDRTLLDLGYGDGCYGFVFSLPIRQLHPLSVIHVLIANTNIPVGVRIHARDLRTEGPPAIGPGEAKRLRRLEIAGWVAHKEEQPRRRVRALIDQILVAETEASSWTTVHLDGVAHPARRFELRLPRRFADGRTHAVRVFDDLGEELVGSPLALWSPAEAEEPSAQQQDEDGAIPIRSDPDHSTPFNDFDRWKAKFPIVFEHPALVAPSMILLVGQDQTDRSIESLARDERGSWIGAVLPNGAGALTFSADDLNQALAENGEDCKILVFAPSGAVFEPGAIQALVEPFGASDSIALVCSDFSLSGNSSAGLPAAFPAFDYERFLEQGYSSFLFAVRRGCITGLSGDVNLFDVVARVIENCHSGSKIAHVPKFLATLPPIDMVAATDALHDACVEHLKRRRVAANVTRGAPAVLPNVRVQRRPTRGSVSVILSTRDAPPDATQKAAEALTKQTKKSFELILGGPAPSSARQTRLADLEREPLGENNGGVLSTARAANLAAGQAQGDYLCFVDSCEPFEADWLEELLSRIAEDGVGAVGPLLTWPNGIIKSAGLTVGPDLQPDSIAGELEGAPGYLDMMRVSRACSALAGDCLLLERQLFERLGGFDHLAFPFHFSAVDLCFKIAESGKRLIYTPHCRFTSYSPDRLDRRSAIAEFYDRELNRLRVRWGGRLEPDFRYSPQLATGVEAFSALANPRRSSAALVSEAFRDSGGSDARTLGKNGSRTYRSKHYEK
jgi:O-antigen biosynthesis protein